MLNKKLTSLGKRSGKWSILWRRREIRNIRRNFWIVNGFSCLAKAAAIRKLAKRDDVSYIYLDKFARPLKKPLPMSDSQFHARGSCQVEEEAFSRLLCQAFPGMFGNRGRNGMGGRKRHWTRCHCRCHRHGFLPPSLIRALAKNPKEQFNGKDDDNNGLIDDVFGYDFISNTGYILRQNHLTW